MRLNILINFRGFPKIPSLKVLHLCENEFLHYLGKRSLSGLSNLEELRLCSNGALTDIDPSILAFPITENGANVWPNIKKVNAKRKIFKYRFR